MINCGWQSTIRNTMQLCFFILSLSIGHAAATADNWNGFGGPSADFTILKSPQFRLEDSSPTVRWQLQIGEGLSSAAIYDDAVYVSYLESTRDEEEGQRPKQMEGLAAIRRRDGQPIWHYRWDAGWREDQEAFGGKPRAPQATPLVTEDSVVVLGFTGWLHCLDRKSGDVLWKVDLVQEFDAIPVQFGYSASPVLCDGKLLVLAGGKKGGLVAYSLRDGRAIWNVPCDEASYATPVVCTVGGDRHVVFVTRDDIIGVAADDGTERWRYALAKPGMTNVPTPLPLGDGRLAVSGQGIDGTRELIVSKRNGQWTVTEGWTNKEQFFYCNWLLSNNRILGCNGNLLVAIDAETGQRVGRWRGFDDANLIRCGEAYYVLDGKGALSVLRQSNTGFNLLGRYQVLDERCWTPLSLADAELYCRGGSTLICCSLNDDGADNAMRLKPLRIRNKSLELKSLVKSDGTTTNAKDGDPVEQVVARFEESGAPAAWKTYLEVRQNGLNLEQREELAELAMQQGLTDFGKRLLQHAVDDLGVEAAGGMQRRMLDKYVRQPSNKIEQAENGLSYIEIGIKNSSNETVHTVVRGPKQHSFSYGIPFPSGKMRIEKWPVGTKLFASDNEVPGNVLLELKKADAGKTLEIGKQPQGER